jgi:ferric-dicitrate binding protein FerR (iron transport regulator)
MKKEDLVDKWLNDELTPEEFEVIRTLPEFSSYQKIDDFVKRISLPENDVESGLKGLKSNLEHVPVAQKSKVIALNVWSKVAALLVLIFASYYFISNSATTESTNMAETRQVLLPDDSGVLLNGNSEIAYKKLQWNKARELTLEGEAYFEVNGGDRFVVKTQHGNINVMGTKFNIISRKGQFSVGCFEGMVRIEMGDVSIDLPAGKTAQLAEGDLQLSNTYISKPTWIYNESSFDDIALKHVFSELEKHYKIKLSTKNIDVNLRFAGSFPNDDLEAALQAVTLPFNLNYRIDQKDAVTIFGEDITN